MVISRLIGEVPECTAILYIMHLYAYKLKRLFSRTDNLLTIALQNNFIIIIHVATEIIILGEIHMKFVGSNLQFNLPPSFLSLPHQLWLSYTFRLLWVSSFLYMFTSSYCIYISC